MLFVYRVDGPRQFMTRDVILTRIAGISAICVAIFPTRGSGCVLNGETLRPFLSNAQGGLDLVQSIPAPTQLHAPCATSSLHAQAVGGSEFILQGCLHTDLTAHLGVTSPFWNNFHYIAAAVLFAILFYFTLFVFRRVQIEQDVINGQIGPINGDAIVFISAVRCASRWRWWPLAAQQSLNGIWDHWYHGGKAIALPLCLRRLA